MYVSLWVCLFICVLDPLLLQFVCNVATLLDARSFVCYLLVYNSSCKSMYFMNSFMNLKVKGFHRNMKFEKCHLSSFNKDMNMENIFQHST